MTPILTDDINAIIGYISSIFSDIKLVFFVLFGLSVGLFIIEKILNSFSNPKSEE